MTRPNKHIVFVRNGARSLLYINGVLKDEATANSVINLENNAVLSIANSPCQSTTDRPYEGALDELYIYKRALSADDVLELYLGPDKIQTTAKGW